MLVSLYLDSIENTEDEALFFGGLQKLTEDKDVAKGLEKAQGIPGLGKLMAALTALAGAQSVAEFKETEHYERLKDWNIVVHDLEKGHLSLNPGPKHLKKMLPVAAALLAAVVGLLLWKRRRKRICQS